MHKQKLKLSRIGIKAAFFVLLSIQLSCPAVATQVDIALRETAREHFNENFLTEDAPIQWTGNVQNGNPGTTSQVYRDRIFEQINFFRRHAGLGEVSENLEFSDKAQHAALMMSANNQLSHYPGTDWIHYSEAGAEAASKSNLYLGVNGVLAIDGYMYDPGANNYFVGHRNWILRPETLTMGTGDIPSSTNPTYWKSNALWVVTTEYEERPVRSMHNAWPPVDGYTPARIIYPRWSFKSPGMDLSQAEVQMWDQNGSQLTTQVENRSAGWTPFVWNTEANDKLDTLTDDQWYRVRISNIIGAASSTFEYTVVIFDPENRLEPVEYLNPEIVETDSQVQISWGTPSENAWILQYSSNGISWNPVDGESHYDGFRVSITTAKNPELGNYRLVAASDSSLTTPIQRNVPTLSLTLLNPTSGEALLEWTRVDGSDGYEYGVWNGGTVPNPMTADSTTTEARVMLVDGWNHYAIRNLQGGVPSSWELVSLEWEDPTPSPPPAPGYCWFENENTETGEVDFVWQAVQDEITGYEYGFWNGSSVEDAASTDSTTTSARVNFRHGTNIFAVRAIKRQSHSDWTLSYAAYWQDPELTPPPNPSGVSLSVTDTQSGAGRLSWSAVSPSTGYEYGVWNGSTVENPLAVGPEVTRVNLQLSAGTNRYAVRTLKEELRSGWVQVSVHWDDPFTLPPGIPTNVSLYLLDASRGLARFSWSAPSGSPSFEYGFWNGSTVLNPVEVNAGTTHVEVQLFDGNNYLAVRSSRNGLYSNWAIKSLSWEDSSVPPPPEGFMVTISDELNGIGQLSWVSPTGIPQYEIGFVRDGVVYPQSIWNAGTGSVTVRLGEGDNQWAIRSVRRSKVSEWVIASVPWHYPGDPDFSPPYPDPPTLWIADASQGEVTVSWTVSESDESRLSLLKHFTLNLLYRGLPIRGYTITPTAGQRTFSTTIRLEPEVLHDFYLAATSTTGEIINFGPYPIAIYQNSLPLTVETSYLEQREGTVVIGWNYGQRAQQSTTDEVFVAICRSSDGGQTWDYLGSQPYPETEFLDTNPPRGVELRYQVRTQGMSGMAVTPWIGTESIELPDVQLINLSTRGWNGSGDEAMIAGFFLEGPADEPISVVVRMLGPSLAELGVEGTSSDTQLAIYNTLGEEIIANNNWREDSRSGDLERTGLAPHDLEAALHLDLVPGLYTAVGGGDVGAVLFEVYLMDQHSGLSSLSNLSTRGLIKNDQPQIGGFVIGGDQPKQVVLRLLGPGLGDYGLTRVLANPRLQVYEANSAYPVLDLMGWAFYPGSEILEAAGLAPSNMEDCAFITTLSPGAYTLVGMGGEGLVLTEIYIVE